MSDAALAVPNNAVAQDGRPMDSTSDATGRIAELRVSGNLMTLETGLFCVFQAPGIPLPDPTNGLPGVRVSLAPGQAGRPDAVSICTFRADGWLDGSAALVRVTDGPAQILVTIYQNGRQRPDAAPRLQVLKLSGDLVEPAPEPPAQVPAPQEEPEILAHVQRTGDIGGAVGDWIGLRGSGLWMEGFGITPQQRIDLSDIEYQGVLGRGWLSPWVEGGKYCGSRGMALPLLGLTIRLKGDAAKAFECTYSATFVDGSTVGPVAEGQVCEAGSLAALEAFQIHLHPRNNQTIATGRAAKPRATTRGTRR